MIRCHSSKWAAATGLLLLLGSGCAHPPPLPQPLAVASSSRLANIASTTADGTVIVLADRSTWIVRPDDRSKARQWRVADLVEVRAAPESAGAEGTPHAYAGILTNQETGGSIRVRKGADFSG